MNYKNDYNLINMNYKHDYNLKKYVFRRHNNNRISTKYLFLIICLALMSFIMWEGSTRMYVVLNFKELNKSSRDKKYANDGKTIDRPPSDVKYMLLWTPQDYAPFYYFNGGQEVFIDKKCTSFKCFITADRSLFGGDLTKFDAIAFNGRSLYNNNTFEIPKPRLYRQKYVFFNLESAENYPICGNEFDNFFNWTATYRLDSDIPFPYIQIKNQRDEVVGAKQNMEWPENYDTDEEFDYRQNKTKAVAWFVSNCNSRSGRDRYAYYLQEQLKKYGWTLDIYGDCGPLKCPKHLNNICISILERDYFFYLSFENSFADDYVTEKLLTALQHNVVPIVLGGADYNRFLPPGSYLDATKTSSDDLAATINEMILSPSLYNKFFKWKSLYKYSDPSKTDNVCALCAALNNETFFGTSSYYKHFRYWWYPKYDDRCPLVS